MIHDVINSRLSASTHTPDIIKQCIHKLKPGIDDGDFGFKSDHIITGSHRLHVILSLLYNLMLLHGYTPTDLLKSSIISLPKDVNVSLSNIDNYRGMALFSLVIVFVNCMILILYFCIGIICIHLTCNLVIKRVTQQQCVH